MFPDLENSKGVNAPHSILSMQLIMWQTSLLCYCFKKKS